MSFSEDFLTNIKAGAQIIQIISHETLRIHAIVAEAAATLNRELYAWDQVGGLRKWNEDERRFDEQDKELRQRSFILEFYAEQDEQMILLLEDFHPPLEERNHETIRRLRNIALLKSADKTLVLSQPFYVLPRELEKEIQVMDLPLPSLSDLHAVYKFVCKQHGLDGEASIEDGNDQEKVLEAALGLSVMEAALAFGKAIVQEERITKSEIPLIIREKGNIIRKSGFLEYYHPQEGLDDIGGLEALKGWLQRRGNAFGPGAKDYGLDTPKGVLLLGVAGTGKSLAAKAVASAWHFPLLRLDMGKIFGGIVGESESNIRQALGIAETIAPSILWIDEIEKGMSGLSGSGSTDGGTTSRVLGTFLTWLQEKTKPVFVVATANDISTLPPELLRKGRVDEIFFVDLPGPQARRDIFAIHLQKKGREELEEFDLVRLAAETKGFSGAEIEEAIKEALFQAFDEGETLRTEHIVGAIRKTYPLSKTMAEMISQLRKWAKTRAVLASEEAAEEISVEKDVPRLRHEYANPFITK